MNRTQLKLIACASMLTDHMGFLLFPRLGFLRWAGRLAMPLFAFFIGEGCVHTSNRRKYFLSVFLLGVFCQAVYFAEDILTYGRIDAASDCWYFNILFTFSLSIPACFLLSDVIRKKEKEKKLPLLLLYIAAAAVLTFLFREARLRGASIRTDYGFCGFLIPLAPVLSDDKKKKLLAFTAALFVYCAVFAAGTPYVWFSLGAAVLLLFYNGLPGSGKFKYFFYAFYPAHLGILYLISEAFF